ncbi:MAG: class I SAM-dependent RNA methyltransferase [Acidobacteria bacterium]|nr:class I SAM-dependent RNA methyltransferase [Acidobacteriota bacterium]
MNVKIEKLIYGGEGLGHADGKTVFVPFVLPGEVVSIRPTEQKKKFVRGRVQHLVTPSDNRAAALCKHFTACGGCHYQHMGYPAQLETKTQILRETLSRLGRITWNEQIQAHASPPFGYRNRAQWKIRPVAAKPAIGYFQSGSSALCAVEQCPILSPLLEKTLLAFRDSASAGNLPASIQQIEAFADAKDEYVLLTFSMTDFPSSPKVIFEQIRTVAPWASSILLHQTSRDQFELDGPGFLQYATSKHFFRVGHLSFFQVNRFLVEEMLATVLAGAQGNLALDLFAGAGLFSLPLAGSFDRIIAVEANPAAARDLTKNAESTAGKVQAINSEVDDFLARQKESPNMVVLDPPRAGISPQTLKRLIALHAAEIRYVSCDPATLARDLAAFTASGYSIAEIHWFDLFPQTFHIESYVRLVRNPV